MARFARERACLGAKPEDRQVENVPVSVRNHAQQLSVVVGLLRVRRMHERVVVFKRQVAQAEIDADKRNNAEIARLDVLDHGLRPLDLCR